MSERLSADDLDAIAAVDPYESDVPSLVAEIRAAWAESEALKEALRSQDADTDGLLDRLQDGEGRLRLRLRELEAALAALVEAGDEATDFTSGPAVTAFNEALDRARALVGSVPQPAAKE